MKNPMELSEEELRKCVEKCIHTIGLDYEKPFRRGGILIYKPYRNYFTTYVGEFPWPDLERAGFAKHSNSVILEDGTEKTCYFLTPDGLQWLARELKICICLTY